MTAIQDAVALANWICTLQSKKAPEIENSFKEYHAERYSVVKIANESSKMFNHLGGKVKAPWETKLWLRTMLEVVTNAF